MKKFLKDNYIIISMVIIFLIIQFLSFIHLGYNYTINSDDLSYLESGIIFHETGKITMHGVLSAQAMPGLTFLIAYFCIFFKTTASLVLALKIFWIAMGTASLIVLYKIVRIYTNKYLSIIPCLFLLAPDFIWTNNLILTETPFMLIFLLLVYNSIKFLHSHEKKYFIYIIVCYIIGIYIRPTIGLYPVGLIICLIIQKFNWKKLLKMVLVASIVTLISLSPWIIRNYRLFNRFIPLTYGMGNPLLLGTYQGYGYPTDDELDYNNIVLSDQMKYYIKDETPRNYMKVYYLLEYDGLIAKYRMNEWWKNDKKSMLHSYLLSKPKIMLLSSYYGEKIFGLPDSVNLILRKVDFVLFLISLILIIIRRKHLLDCGLLLFSIFYHVVLYSYSFAYGRYAITLFFLRFIIIGIGIDTICELFQSRRKKYEVVNNNPRV